MGKTSIIRRYTEGYFSPNYKLVREPIHRFPRRKCSSLLARVLPHLPPFWVVRALHRVSPCSLARTSGTPALCLYLGRWAVHPVNTASTHAGTSLRTHAWDGLLALRAGIYSSAVAGSPHRRTLTHGCRHVYTDYRRGLCSETHRLRRWQVPRSFCVLSSPLFSSPLFILIYARAHAPTRVCTCLQRSSQPVISRQSNPIAPAI